MPQPSPHPAPTGKIPPAAANSRKSSPPPAQTCTLSQQGASPPSPEDPGGEGRAPPARRLLGAPPSLCPCGIPSGWGRAHPVPHAPPHRGGPLSPARPPGGTLLRLPRAPIQLSAPEGRLGAGRTGVRPERAEHCRWEEWGTPGPSRLRFLAPYPRISEPPCKSCKHRVGGCKKGCVPGRRFQESPARAAQTSRKRGHIQGICSLGDVGILGAK